MISRKKWDLLVVVAKRLAQWDTKEPIDKSSFAMTLSAFYRLL